MEINKWRKETKKECRIVYTTHDYQLVCSSHGMFDVNMKPCERCLDGHYIHCLQTKCLKNSRAKSLLGTLDGYMWKYSKAYNTSDTRGQSPSFGTTYQKTGKELMSRDELSVMDGSKCILQLRGVRPFLSDKFDITKHKRYKELSDFDKKNAFDVERYLKHELRLRMDEEFDCYEVDVSEESTA